MTTNNAVNSSLSGQTGTGSFVGSTSPTLSTPTIGAATATSVTFSPSTGGNVGTTTNNNASAGVVGELISSVIASGSAISLVSGTPADVTSISLTAGDWNVEGNVTLVNGSGLTSGFSWISTTSATLPDASLYSGITIPATNAGTIGLTAPYVRLSLSGTTTVYLSTKSTSSGGTATACGGIYARRAR